MTLPTIYENNEVKVYHNCSGEIFIENKHTNCTIRVSPEYSRTIVTAQDGIMTPWATNGLPAFVISAL